MCYQLYSNKRKWMRDQLLCVGRGSVVGVVLFQSLILGSNPGQKSTFHFLFISLAWV